MIKMHIKVTGINGYLGKLLSERLTDVHHEVSGIDRKLLYGHTEKLKHELKGSDVIINLAGTSILKRWTAKTRQLIYDSRVKTTANLIKAITELEPQNRPQKLITVSAIGIYKTGELHNEDSINFSSDFIGKVAQAWEDTLGQLPPSVHQTIFRLGIVLGKNSKTIRNLLLPFKLGLGGKIGSGNQAFPFVHEKDVVNAFLWDVDKNSTNNIFNLVAPQQITNKEFTKALAKYMKRPAFLSVPPFVLKVFFGKAAVLLTESPKVSSDKLTQAGFRFQYPTIDSTLKEIIS